MKMFHKNMLLRNESSFGCVMQIHFNYFFMNSYDEKCLTKIFFR